MTNKYKPGDYFLYVNSLYKIEEVIGNSYVVVGFGEIGNIRYLNCYSYDISFIDELTKGKKLGKSYKLLKLIW